MSNDAQAGPWTTNSPGQWVNIEGPDDKVAGTTWAAVAHLNALEARVSEVEAERDRLRDKAAQLVPYASHLGNCDLDSWVLDESCSCGLFQLLTALTPKAGETA